jgi:hypothetical protein
MKELKPEKFNIAKFCKMENNFTIHTCPSISYSRRTLLHGNIYMPTQNKLVMNLKSSEDLIS